MNYVWCLLLHPPINSHWQNHQKYIRRRISLKYNQNTCAYKWKRNFHFIAKKKHRIPQNKNKHIGANDIHFRCWMNSPLTPCRNPGTSAPGLPAVYICPPNRSVPVPFIPPPLLTGKSFPASSTRKIFARDLIVHIFASLFCVFSFLSRFYSRFSL